MASDMSGILFVVCILFVSSNGKKIFDEVFANAE
jgi:hypothetical protein